MRKKVQKKLFNVQSVANEKKKKNQERQIMGIHR